MEHNKLLRQRIKNVIEAPNLTDAGAIQGVCRLLNIKPPLVKLAVVTSQNERTGIE